MLAADPRWYEKYSDGHWHDEAFRDPWVFADPDGDGWHMLITARANHGDAYDRGVVGHAWSADLESWELREPLSSPGEGFGQLEVFQTHVVEITDPYAASWDGDRLALTGAPGSTPGHHGDISRSSENTTSDPTTDSDKVLSG